MARKFWRPRAAAIQQTASYTIGGTWLASSGEEIGFYIGGVLLKQEIVTANTPAQIAAGVVAQINATSFAAARADDEIWSAAGQLVNEFAEVEAVDDGAGVFSIKVKTFGKPVDMSVYSDTASGTVTPGPKITATSKNHIDNAENWVNGADGSSGLPADGDDVVFDEGNVPALYGLDNLAIQPNSVLFLGGWVGWLGLPPVNQDTAGKFYVEHRAQEWELADSSATLDDLIIVDRGNGAGSKMINISSPRAGMVAQILSTGAASPPAGPNNEGFTAYAVNLDLGADAEIYFLRGSLALCPRIGQAMTIAKLEVGSVGLQDALTSLLIAEGAAASSGGIYNWRSGSSIVRGSIDATSHKVRGGEVFLRMPHDNADQFTSFEITGGTVYGETLIQGLACNIGGEGVWHQRYGEPQSSDLGDIILTAGATIRDRANSLDLTATASLYNCALDDVNLELGAPGAFTFDGTP